ncbi:MAG TPA: HEAT repeat domain-containing protein [Thermoanaerobaculia bacterium]|nr:HEAT repeat domain-containing protein [Thermoanaerobaculia bacterium]
MTEGPPPEEPLSDDEEVSPRSPAGRLVIRFFVLPLLVVGTAVGIFLLFSLMTFERRSPRDYLSEVRGGSAGRRWQAAFELSRRIGTMKPGPERDAIAIESLRLFRTLSPSRPEDVRVRRYLVLVLGKLRDRAAVPDLVRAAGDPDPETRLYAIWALGMIGDPRGLDAVLEASRSEDPGIRKMAAYVMGKLGDRRAIERLKVLLEDRVPDVRWNAAIALASLNDGSGIAVLRSMIDLQALARQAQLTSDQAEAAMVNALKAFALLRDEGSLPLLEKVAREDPNLRVRDAARAAVEATRRGQVSTVTSLPRSGVASGDLTPSLVVSFRVCRHRSEG